MTFADEAGILRYRIGLLVCREAYRQRAGRSQSEPPMALEPVRRCKARPLHPLINDCR
ncbi:hypothetical protein KCP78_02735 [Salmonella enterica subsp. enterica]|nr:hypothetical protein KCP78_02735 [Salmonella enterica subsp. enterica]